MTQGIDIDGVLIHWGERLFYHSNRRVKGNDAPRLRGQSRSQRAAYIRAQIEATVLKRAPQVMVKVTGGGRGMKAIAAHFRYISKNGKLDIEDELGNKEAGKDAVHALAEDWRLGGTLIDDEGYRREAFNIMLSMPRGTDPQIVQRAAREFAQAELDDHKYVMVLHDHQANPHVHISVRAESKSGKRLNPRKADLHRWRETFAEKLRGWGVEASATRQATRGVSRRPDVLWRLKAEPAQRLRTAQKVPSAGNWNRQIHAESVSAWQQIACALGDSNTLADGILAESVLSFVRNMTSPASAIRSLSPNDEIVSLKSVGITIPR
jgi:hypothetical protein